MFSRHRGSELVSRGTYLCLTTGEFMNVAQDDDHLPGDANVPYLQVSPLAALIIGPVAGMAFVIFLPLAVPLFCLWLIGKRVGLGLPSFVKSYFRQPAQVSYATSHRSIHELLAEIEEKQDHLAEEK